MVSGGCINHFRTMWNNFRVRRCSCTSTATILSLLGKPHTHSFHPEDFILLFCMSTFLGPDSKHWMGHLVHTILCIDNAVSWAISLFVISSIQATVWGIVITASAVLWQSSLAIQPQPSSATQVLRSVA